MSDSDSMLRDPLREAVRCEVSGDLEERLRAMLPPEAVGKVLVVATPAVKPRHIIDATLAGACGVCGGGVWVSPSTARTGGEKFYACTECLGETLVSELVFGLHAAKGRC